ncbi:hypothetical protein [Streptomyces sp. TS71-3]|uniref:hypothetical protein n=1 Tax=Streptomyces sp. TS71-3 TaxID=2733862 RepID=UPI001B15CF8E|nr:hypothetical protein [Streptomyces sp. TS71-3]GHJ35259.1 hypothetical protein Sm713_08680 [Streptomyces sp. TS71-3]
MGTSETSRFVRLRVDLVVEIEDSVALTGAALQRIEEEAGESGSDGGSGAGAHGMTAEERIHAITAVQQDEAEALAYLVDPFDLVHGVPGVDLAQASWSSEEIDYDPDSPDWRLGVDDGGEDNGTGED